MDADDVTVAPQGLEAISKAVQQPVADPPAVHRRLVAYVGGIWLPGLGTGDGWWMRMVEEPDEARWMHFWFARVTDPAALRALIRCNPTSQEAARIALTRAWKWRPKEVFALLDREKMVEVEFPLDAHKLTYEVAGLAVAQVCYMTRGDPVADLRKVLEG